MSGKYKDNLLVGLPVLVMVVIGWLTPVQIQAREDKKETSEEIIKISKLARQGIEFTLKRDIFSPDPMTPVDPGEQKVKPQESAPPPPTITEVPQIKIKTPEERRQEAEDQTRRELSYEGYVIKDSKSCALVTLNSELLAVTDGDMISEKIKIVKIQPGSITVEVPVNVTIEEKEETITHVFEIRIKGDEENEIQ